MYHRLAVRFYSYGSMQVAVFCHSYNPFFENDKILYYPIRE
ncbi:hypothetical protein B4110_1401 [Parageobacillus toebii]|uniref:Uncharacterized protein n=1 Tax=Parageobacillus toebii TaxID=153151 RepID=A0A150N444_9BACL|nr:hypothetical protein B4110_1401 [Parageobacillus toebii]